MQKTVVLIDGSNLWETAVQLGFRIDFSKIPLLFEGHNVLRYMYFTALPPKDVQSNTRQTVDYLEFNGFTVIQKETKEFRNAETGQVKVKGNMDIDMCIEAVKLCPFVTDIVLFTGDGDFVPLLKYLKERGVHITVVSSKVTEPPMIARELRRTADTFIEIGEHRAMLELNNESAKRPSTWSSRVRRGAQG